MKMERKGTMSSSTLVARVVEGAPELEPDDDESPLEEEDDDDDEVAWADPDADTSRVPVTSPPIPADPLRPVAATVPKVTVGLLLTLMELAIWVDEYPEAVDAEGIPSEPMVSMLVEVELNLVGAMAT